MHADIAGVAQYITKTKLKQINKTTVRIALMDAMDTIKG